MGDSAKNPDNGNWAQLLKTVSPKARKPASPSPRKRIPRTPGPRPPTKAAESDPGPSQLLPDGWELHGMRPDGLTVREWKYLAGRLSGMTVKHAADFARVSVPSAVELENSEVFVEAYRAELRAGFGDAINRLSAAAITAADTLLEAMGSTHPIATRVKAAESVLDRVGLKEITLSDERKSEVIAAIESRRSLYSDPPRLDADVETPQTLPETREIDLIP